MCIAVVASSCNNDSSQIYFHMFIITHENSVACNKSHIWYCSGIVAVLLLLLCVPLQQDLLLYVSSLQQDEKGTGGVDMTDSPSTHRQVKSRNSRHSIGVYTDTDQ